MYPSKFVHPFQLGKWYPMSVDRITDKNITSSSPTSSLFLNSTQKNAPLSAGRFSVFRIGRRFRPAKAFFFCGLSDSCHRAQYLYFNDEKPSGHSVCTIPAEKKLQNAKKRQDISPVSFWCGWRESNPHAHTDTSTSSLPVYQFQHSRKMRPAFESQGLLYLLWLNLSTTFFKRQHF